MDRYSYSQAVAVASRVLPTRFNQVQSGRNNWVFESGDRILAIPRHARVKSYDLRVNASNFLKSQGLPVPEIFEYSPGQEGSPEYLLSAKSDGQMIDLSSLTSMERDIVHRSAGDILRKIHSLSRQKYGRLTSNLVGENSSWVEFTDNFFTESIRRVRACAKLYAQFGETLEREYSEGRQNLLEINKSSLLHADFHLNNLLFKDFQVCAILDLDLVTSGDPNWDSGHYCHTFNIAREEGVNSFRAGYNCSLDHEIERLYCLMIWARKIGSQAIQRPDALSETIPELKKILAGEI